VPAVPIRARPLPDRSQVGTIRKTHNVPLDDWGLALRLDVELALVGAADAPVRLMAWFASRRNGVLLRSVLRPWRDGQGHLFTQTEPLRTTMRAGWFGGTLIVPYGAFPHPRNGSSYEVEARLMLVRVDRVGRAAVLGRGSTTFTVHADTVESEARPAPMPEVPEGEAPVVFPAPAGMDVEEVVPLPDGVGMP
jgi:hypothetical protein